MNEPIGGELGGELGNSVTRFIAERQNNPPLGRTRRMDDMAEMLDGAITTDGLGASVAWDLFETSVVPNTITLSSPRFLAFIPMAPTAAAIWMDAAVGAASFSAESWLESAGAVAAENQALDFLADVIGLPFGSGGCFTSGGSSGNLSALAVAREQAGTKRLVAVADSAHASVRNTLHLLGLVPLPITTGSDGRFTAAALRHALQAERSADQLAAVVASAGSTNAGVVDDLAGLSTIAREHGAWVHVDAAYGGAALLVPGCRPLFSGIENADSVIIDPHKWLFSTAGSCALLYRRPALAAAVHTQHGPYLDMLHRDGDSWNPSDYAFQLTRRASGLPFWFTLVVYGTAALVRDVERAIDLARYAAERLRAIPSLEVILEPELSVVLFRRAGWQRADWAAWAAGLLERQVAFVAPTTWRGEPVGRLVFLHPETTTSIVDEVVATLR